LGQEVEHYPGGGWGWGVICCNILQH
jgi:hypothetical protein